MTKLKRILSLILILFVCSCDASQTISEKRVERATQGTGDIVIGIVETSSDSNLFLQGVELAIEEINQEGGVFGRRIQPLLYDDRGEVKEGQRIARELSGNPDVIAVVGHLWSNIAIPASITYDKNGILFISPGASNPALTRYGGDFTFRIIPTDEETGRQMGDFAVRQGVEKVVIFYQRDAGFRTLADVFNEQVGTKGVEVVTTRSFFSWQTDFRAVLSMIKKEYEFDAIYIAGTVPAAGFLIRQARNMDITVPILGSGGMDSPILMTIAGKAANGTIVPTVFNPGLSKSTTRDFVSRFQAKYGVDPDTWAAQGYDAIRILAFTIEKNGSAVPILLSTTLRFIEDWEGVTGHYSFTISGDISEKPVFFKKLVSGTFRFMEPETEAEVSIFDFVEESTLKLPVEGVIPTIDPGFIQDATSIELTEQLFLGLTDLDPETYKPVPELATGWSVTDDGLTYRFQMRHDAFWTDGGPVTAHDVVWGIRRNIRPETEAPYAYMLYILKNAQAINTGEIKDDSKLGVSAVDDFTVEFTLEHSAAYFPAMAGSGIYRPLPREVIETYGKYWTEPGNIRTNGSYRLAAWEKGMVMILRKNPDYCEADNVSIPEVRYYVLHESSMGMAMYENNELDIMGSSYLRLPLSMVPHVKANPTLSREYSRQPIFTTYAYAFNTNRPPVDDPLVRKAISAAIDRELLIELITKGDEEPAATFTRPPIFGSVDPKVYPNIGIKLDPGQAKKWLAEAGYPDGKGFPELTLVYNASETHRTIARAVQISLKHHLNIDIRLDEKTWEGYVESLDDPPHIFRYGYGADYPDANNFLNEQFHPFRSANYTGWKNSEFAELIDSAERDSDPEKRKAYYRRAEEILCKEEAAAIPLYFEIAHCLVKPRVAGWYHMALGGQHIRNWSFREEK